MTLNLTESLARFLFFYVLITVATAFHLFLARLCYILICLLGFYRSPSKTLEDWRCVHPMGISETKSRRKKERKKKARMKYRFFAYEDRFLKSETSKFLFSPKWNLRALMRAGSFTIMTINTDNQTNLWTDQIERKAHAAHSPESPLLSLIWIK